jgi:hypothetical protein
MQRGELLRAHLLGEIVLLCTGVSILVASVMVAVAALTSAALQ